MIDTHAHLNFEAFSADREDVIRRTLQGKMQIINASSNYKTSVLAVEMQKKGVFASVGLHPINIKQTVIDQTNRPEDVLEEIFDYKKYKELAKRAIAIGEIGLDYLRKPEDNNHLSLFKKKQKDIFLQQLNLAKELNYPIILHCRKAHDEMIEILKSFKLKGVVHCFTGNIKQAKEYLSLGFYLGFNGIIFKLNVDGIIQKIPLERILLETDCPFLSPPQVSRERNEPLNIKYIAERISELRKEPLEKIKKITTQNAKELFSL